MLQLHLIYNEHVPDEIDCLRVLIRDDLHPRLRISSSMSTGASAGEINIDKVKVNVKMFESSLLIQIK